MSKVTIRITFWLIFIGMVVIQLFFNLRTRIAGEDKIAGFKSNREGSCYTVYRAVRTLIFIVYLLLDAFKPSQLELFSAPFPDWVRLSGVLFGLVSYVVYGWSRVVLGKSWSSRLMTGENHVLVTEGPYARIRHPIYLAMICFLASLALVSCNYLLIAVLLFSTVDLLLRIPREEQMMIEVFGDTYREYIKRTGKILPKIS